jgi:regulator of RNase E activity RraB
MSRETDDADEWDFYPCRVDDRPASIFLNLRYEHEERPTAATLYWLRIRMLDAAEHGMGTGAEAEALYPVEDALVDATMTFGLTYVGRLRTDGAWQIVFYGASGNEDALGAVARGVELGGRQIELGSKPDSMWSYYREFLLPDDERRQWMSDRRIVELLEEHGDLLSTPRRVDHWAYFPSADSRDAFVKHVTRDGFEIEGVSDDADGDQSFGAQVVRTDTVELEAIHEVVMTLVRLAEQHGGTYDGWECPVERPPSN